MGSVSWDADRQGAIWFGRASAGLVGHGRAVSGVSPKGAVWWGRVTSGVERWGWTRFGAKARLGLVGRDMACMAGVRSGFIRTGSARKGSGLERVRYGLAGIAQARYGSVRPALVRFGGQVPGEVRDS